MERGQPPEIHWQLQIGARAIPSLVSDEIMVVRGERCLLGLRIVDGQELWRLGHEDSFLDPVVAGQRCWALSWDGTLVCLDVSDGGRLWQAKVEDPAFADLAVNQNAAVLACRRGPVLAFAAGSGVPLREYDSGGEWLVAAATKRETDFPAGDGGRHRRRCFRSRPGLRLQNPGRRPRRRVQGRPGASRRAADVRIRLQDGQA